MAGFAQGGEQLALYEGHKHESYKLDCCLTPSDGHVICGSEDGARSCSPSCHILMPLAASWYGWRTVSALALQALLPRQHYATPSPHLTSVVI